MPAGTAAATQATPTAQPVNAPIKVLHWWRHDSERMGVEALKATAHEHGLAWLDAYSGTDVVQRYPQLLSQPQHRPAAALVPAYAVAQLARADLLVPLEPIALSQSWEDSVPMSVQNQAKHEQRWMAAPLSIHGFNWLWVHADLAQRLGIYHPPETWQDLISMLEKARSAGVLALAIGNHDWELAMLFELLSAGYLGPQRFRQWFILRQVDQIQPEMLAPLFERLQQLQPYMQQPLSHTSWSDASSQLAQGQALMQLGGNWIEGALQKTAPGTRYFCWRFPDTQGSVHFNADLFVFFQQPEEAPGTLSTSQQKLAHLLMQAEVQTSVNRASGAPPARVDAMRALLTPCGQESLNAMRSANTRNTLLPSFYMGTAHANRLHGLPALLRHSLHGRLSPQQAALQLHHMVGSAP